jgi:hypothetical protein
MPSVKATPNLPASSRMQMPSTGDKVGDKLSGSNIKNGKATAMVKQGGVAKKVVGSSKGKIGVKGSNPYC